METNNSPSGLIATTGAEAMPPLTDLAVRSGWPLVLKAGPRRLATELSLRNPACLLFWLDDEQRITETARLVAWTRERGHRPYRVAITYRMQVDVEPLFRAAGAHGFLPITDQSSDAVTSTVWAFIADFISVANGKHGRTNAKDALMELVRPP